jgi:hypothetical protein
VKLDWLWHMRGSVPLPAHASRQAVLNRVAAAFERERKRVERIDGAVTFDSPLFSDIMSPNWLTLVIYDHGRAWIDERGVTLRYDVRSLHGFIFCLCAAALFAGIGGMRHDVGQAAGCALFAFAWLYGGNMVLAIFRVPGLFRRAVNGG